MAIMRDRNGNSRYHFGPGTETVCIHLIEQLIWTVILLYEIIFVDITTFLELFISLKHTLRLLIQNGVIAPLKVGTISTISAPGGNERRLTLFTLSCCRK